MGWVREDDLDGRQPAREFTFGFDGQAYVIDLHQDNIDALGELLRSWLDSATAYDELPDPPGEEQEPKRRPPSVPNARRPRSSKRSDDRNRKIREWARANGIETPAAGRISKDTIEAYERSQLS